VKTADFGSANGEDARGIEAGIARLRSRYGLDELAGHKLEALLARLVSDPKAPTADRSPEAVLERHLADSLVGLELDRVVTARRIADLGSGAGLPGLALAAALPTAEVHLVEAQQSKCAFLASVASALSLPNARVVCSRVEVWTDGSDAHDLVVARALAAQPVVLEYAAPLLALGGAIVEWRGRRDADEEARAALAAAELGLRPVEVRRVAPFPGASDRHLHVFEKIAATPTRFPRRPGVARRRPLGA
jgi:16S rRNA (guanine527-N7)-methyltransferase